jgi:mono/diheme cytochrome c family protein
MTRADALAIKAYLFSLAPVRAPAAAANFGFPFNQRWTMTFWNAAFLRNHPFQPVPALTPQQNRGAYLASALGHCGECHTPRNFAFAPSGRQFAGADLQGWRAFNITSDRDAGIGAWSREALAQYLSTGRADGHGAASGPMAEAIGNSLQYLTAEDVQALSAYLAIVKARPGTPGAPAPAAPQTLRASAPWAPGAATPGLGRHVFEGACASCHAWNGGAPASRYAALAGARAVSDPAGANVVQAVLSGSDTRLAGERVKMPAFGRGLSDAEIAAVSNYTLGQFGGVSGTVSASDVHRARAAR